MNHLTSLCLIFILALCLVGCGTRRYTVVVDRSALFSVRLDPDRYKGYMWWYKHYPSYKAVPDEPGKFELYSESVFPSTAQIALWTPDKQEVVFKTFPTKEGDTIFIEPSDWKAATISDVKIAQAKL